MQAKASSVPHRRRRRRGARAEETAAPAEQPDPLPEAADPAHPQHADWLCRHVGRELRRLRRAQGASAYELALPGILSDQTILNNENGRRNPGLLTLVVHCQRLRATLHDVLPPLPLPPLTPNIFG